MSRIAVRIALLAGFSALIASGPASARGHAPHGFGPRDAGAVGHRAAPRHYGHAPARYLPPETRYRDPRYAPVPRPYAGPRAPRFEMQPDPIQAYLPRHTDRPMYNEPPSRFPQR